MVFLGILVNEGNIVEKEKKIVKKQKEHLNFLFNSTV